MLISCHCMLADTGCGGQAHKAATDRSGSGVGERPALALPSSVSPVSLQTPPAQQPRYCIEHVHCVLYRVWSIVGSNPTRGSSFIFGRVTACVTFLCCLYGHGCFFLPSFFISHVKSLL